MNLTLPGVPDKNPALSQWYTPRETAKRVVDFALRVRFPGMSVLEPSAGLGALVRELLDQEINDLHAIDLDTQNVIELQRIEGVLAWKADFLIWEPSRRYDLAVMNPPFESGQAEQHIMRALRFCDRVVAHVPLTTLAGQSRRKALWAKVRITDLAICSTRPSYGDGNGATDMCTISVLLDERRHAAWPQDISIEWWP